MTILDAWLKDMGASGPTLDELRHNRLTWYKIYDIRQGKSGKRRRIEEPLPALKLAQQKLISLFNNFPFTIACSALEGRGISYNVAPHEDAKYILKLDIRKCYQTTTFDLICNSIQRQRLLKVLC